MTPSAKRRPGKSAVADAAAATAVETVAEELAFMGMPEAIHLNDWACHNGHFNTSKRQLCTRCLEVYPGTKSASQRFLVARDEASQVALRDYIQQRQLEAGLSRPSSLEVAEQATQAAALPDEEVLKARDAESDKGIEAPSREELSAEEQTELLRVMMERRKQRDRQIARPPANLAAGELGGEDSSSARGAGSSDDACSDALSFVTAAGSAVPSRQERKRQREQRHRQAKGSDYVTLSPGMHAKRLQTAALLNMGRNDLDHVPGEEVDRVHCMLLTQNIGEVRGGYTCLTRRMRTIEKNPETRGGVHGTVIRVTVATQSVFVPTRDPFELSVKKADLVGELADHALKAVSEIGRKDSAEQKMMRAMLSDEIRGLNMRKTPGIKELVVSGYAGTKL